MADILSDISQDPDITLHLLGNYIGSAYSPQVEVTETDTGHEVAITYDDATDGITTKTFSVEDGDAAEGASGGASVDLTGYLKSADAEATYAPKSHKHAMADVTGLQAALDGIDGHRHHRHHRRHRLHARRGRGRHGGARGWHGRPDARARHPARCAGRPRPQG